MRRGKIQTLKNSQIGTPAGKVAASVQTNRMAAAILAQTNFGKVIANSAQRNTQDYTKNIHETRVVHQNTQFYSIIPKRVIKEYQRAHVKGEPLRLDFGQMWGSRKVEFDAYMKRFLKRNPDVVNIPQKKLKNNLENRYKGHIFHRILGVAPPQYRSVQYPNADGNDLMVVTYKIVQIQGETNLVNTRKLPTGPQTINTWMQPIAKKMRSPELTSQRKAWRAWHMPWGGYGKTINFGTNQGGLHEYVLQKGALIKVLDIQPAHDLIKGYINEVYHKPKSTPTKPNSTPMKHRSTKSTPKKPKSTPRTLPHFRPAQLLSGLI